MLVARKVGLGVIALVAVMVFFFLAPDGVALPEAYSRQGGTLAPIADYATLIDAAIEDYTSVSEIAENADQQLVANGWIARDLLTILAWQGGDVVDGVGALLDSSSTDHRTPAMLGLLLLAIAWWSITDAPRGQRGRPRSRT